jgi:hypothetical protein
MVAAHLPAITLIATVGHQANDTSLGGLAEDVGRGAVDLSVNHRGVRSVGK